ncbi:hypothetical protein ACPCUF_13830 [Streptomyces griseoincarnatus]
MPDVPFDPTRSDTNPPSSEAGEIQSNGSGSWLPRRWRPATGAPDQPDAGLGSPSPSSASPSTDAVQAAPRLHETAGAATHLYGDADVVANVIEELILETRKRDLLIVSE